MKLHLKKSLFIFFLSMCVALTACQKDGNVSPNTPEVDEATATQAIETDPIIDDAISVVDDAIDGNFNGMGNGRVEACGNIDLNLQQRIISIDFGNGCQATFGRNRSGKISVTFTENQRTIVFQNYKVENYALSGTIIQGNITRTRTQISYTTSVNNLAITTPNKKWTISNLQRTVQINLGANPLQLAGNEIRITGTSAGTNDKGENFTTEITTPLIIKGSCFQSGIFYPVSGISIVRVASKPAMTIDYGSGSCDKQVTVTLGTINKTITLP
jgi:hypothetical protein